MERLTKDEGARARRALLQDAALAVLLAAASVASLWSPPALASYDFREPDALAVTLSLVAGVVLVLRRRAPVVVTLVALSATLLLNQLGYSQPISGLAALLALYTTASLRTLRVGLGVALGAAAGIGVVLVRGPVDASLSDWLANGFAVAAAWGIGRAVRVRRFHAAEVEARERATREAQEAETRTLLAEERAATAREMQDLVAHHLTEVTVQLAAARRMLPQDPEGALPMLQGAERVSRSAMEEIRRAGGLLTDGGAADRRPQPTLADVDDLVAAQRASGRQVVSRQEGDLGGVPAGLALTAYRVLEEGLQAAARGQADVPTEVVVRGEGGWLGVEVATEAGDHWHWTEHEAATQPALERLRVRVAAYGGQLRWGKRRDGGFLVVARFPLGEVDGARS